MCIKIIMLLPLSHHLLDMHMRYGLFQKDRWQVLGNLHDQENKSFAKVLQKVMSKDMIVFLEEDALI